MLSDARPLLIWWVNEIRWQLRDHWELPQAVLFPPRAAGDRRGHLGRRAVPAAYSAAEFIAFDLCAAVQMAI